VSTRHLMCFLCKELPFGGCNYCAGIEIYSGVNFFNRD